MILLRIALAATALLLAACGGLPDLSRMPAQAPPEGQVLDADTTRTVARAWSEGGFGPHLGDCAVKLRIHHPDIPRITGIIDARQVRRWLPREDDAVGIPVLVTAGDPRRASKPLTAHAHQLTLQEAVLIARQTGPNQLCLDLHDPRGTTTVNGQPLARADGLLFDYVEREQEQPLLNLQALIAPSRIDQRRGLFLLTPYHRKKIPVVFLHGLGSSPLAFRDMVSHLQRDPLLWQRYQFWFYFYPTGEPWISSAAAFRRDLTELIATLDPDRNDAPLSEMVLVGHSMGGLIARASVSEHSTALYDAYFNRPLDALRLTAAQKDRLRETLLYEPLPWPRRLIFLATPHRGSRFAEGPLEWLARQVIRLPARIVGGALRTTEVLALGEAGVLTSGAYALLRNGEVSVSQLDSANPCVAALQHMPIRQDVQFHSIIGDLTGPRTRLGTDGIVNYESSHLPAAQSERIVQSGHLITDAPGAINEVARILREH